MADQEPDAAAPDATHPNIARVYDYLLGGKDNYTVDRAVGDRIIASVPTVQLGVRAQRALLGRVVRYLLEEAGVRQLIDIGSGLPTADNVHQIAQRIDPGARVVYVDNDPVVLAHARALLATDPATIAVPGDLRDPAAIFGNPLVRRHLDRDQPVGVLLCGILPYILDEEHPQDVVGALIAGVPSGSYLFIHHLLDSGDPAAADLQAELQQGVGRGLFRTWEQVRRLFDGLELVEPGLVRVPDWRPRPGEPTARDHPVLGLACAGVGRKP